MDIEENTMRRMFVMGGYVKIMGNYFLHNISNKEEIFIMKKM
jgi:hypothetical protein